MTAEKPNLVDGLRAAIAEATPEQHRKVDEYPSGFIAEKLPVPSDEELWLTARSETIVSTEHARLTYTSELRETWLAGYHARDACCHQACSSLATKLTAAERRIAELEAEVAELREKLERSDAELHWLRAPRSVTIHVPTATGSPEDDTSALLAAFDVARSSPPRGDWWLVRRTPELTERVAMWLKEHGQDWPIALCRADAAALLDLVFGKKEE